MCWQLRARLRPLLRRRAYVSGLFLDGGNILMSYGSSDIDARLLTLSLGDLEALFSKPFDCATARVLDGGSGEPAPPPGARGNQTVEEFRRRKQHRRMHRRERSAA